MKFFLNALLIIFSWTTLFAQADTIHLTNPSFEGVPFEGDGNLQTRLPKGWFDCGFAGESPPDVHPMSNGFFQVRKPPSHGKTYLGMVTRDNDTWERASSKLSSKLEKGQCYSFSIELARSEIYMSYSRIASADGMVQANYVTPIKLRIYGGTDPCDRFEIIGETSLVRNSRWLKYSFNFQTTEDYEYLTFEAFYKTPTFVPYNGNILLDNASSIIRISCDSISSENKPQEVFASEEEKKEYFMKQKVIRENAAIEKKEKALIVADFNKLVALTKLAGKAIKFSEQITIFKTETFEVADKNYDATSGLNEIFNLIKANPKLSMLIGVKKKDGKETQAKRMKKLEAMVKAAGLNEEAVLIRKKNKIKWSYPWDSENGDLVFYIFDPEN